MPQIGPMEIMVVAVIALIVFGPEKLPEIARTIGRYAAQVRRMANEVRSEFDLVGDADVEDERPAPARTRRPRARSDREPSRDAAGDGSPPEETDEASTEAPSATAEDGSGSEPNSRTADNDASTASSPTADDEASTEPRSQSA